MNDRFGRRDAPRFIAFAIALLILAASCSAGDDGASTTPRTPAGTSTTADNQVEEPDQATRAGPTTVPAEPTTVPAEPTTVPAEPTTIPTHASSEPALIGAEILGTFGRQEIFLSPKGSFGYLQARHEDADDRCLQPLLQAEPACFEVSGARFEIRPRWDASGQRMAFASRENPDLMVANASTGMTTVADADQETETWAWTTQVSPGWLGSRLISFRRDGSLTITDERGIPGLSPGFLADTEVPASAVLYPPLSTQTGSMVVAFTDSELGLVSLDEWRTYPFPNSLERASSRPGPSALRPPLVPIALTDRQQVVVADALPGAARTTGNWTATSGGYLLDLDTGAYTPIFVDGRTQGTAVVALGVSPRVDGLIFLWADDEDPDNPVMRLSTAMLDRLPIDPREAEVIAEASPGVVLAGSAALNPLVWSADNQTAFRIDGEWAHLQLPSSVAPSVPLFSPAPASIDAVVDVLFRYAPSPEVASCMRAIASSSLPGLPGAEEAGVFDLQLEACEGDRSTFERASAFLDSALPDQVNNLYESMPRALRECLYITLKDIGALNNVREQEIIFAAMRCDPDSARTTIARSLEDSSTSSRYNTCRIEELHQLSLEEVDRIATADVADLLEDACALELINPDIPGPDLAEVVAAVEASGAGSAWQQESRSIEGEFDALALSNLEHDTVIALMYDADTSRVVAVFLQSTRDRSDELLELIGPEFGLHRGTTAYTTSAAGRILAGEFEACWTDDGDRRDYLLVATTIFGACESI